MENVEKGQSYYLWLAFSFCISAASGNLKRHNMDKSF